MKAIVVAGGDATERDHRLLDGVELIVAADGGARWLDAAGVTPQLLIGDLDSCDAAFLADLRARGVEIEGHPAEKDASDTELAVARAIEAGADEVTILAALGGERLDHELANLLLLLDPAWTGRRLRLVRGTTTVRALRSGGSLQLEGRLGDIVTLLPVGGDARGIATSGLCYPLHGEPLAMGRSRGVSNVIEAVPASVRLEHGALLVVEVSKEE